MKKKILIISGGISKERLISLDTGQQVANELKKNGYKVKITEPDNNLEKNIKFFKPNVIFNALHGQFGEDGYIQTILERFKIPYTHSGVIESSIAMDKEISKKIFIKNKIKTPKYFTHSYDIKNQDLIKKIKKKLRFPVVVKPLNEGSSVNVFICNKKNIIKILNSIKHYKKVWQLIKESVPLEKSFGDASISQKHCNFFVNKGNAKFEDMKKLINFVSESVFKKTGIKLETEIKILE